MRQPDRGELLESLLILNSAINRVLNDRSLAIEDKAAAAERLFNATLYLVSSNRFPYLQTRLTLAQGANYVVSIRNVVE